eukprot:Protomagalhaensia_wolfi_Nauph_80__1484@NODE_189_length_3241_cov_56_850094_g142_i0_p3_GENE_NODE_189_length_3241_cov_56_850094_g142_i0NODE_189_length_3241_cov_56_850094_g142_i0_p3_ORF_typecomplete_len166_score6_36PRIMA1/PF16101_5/1_6e03PRIMA1/PF16101_5/0_016Ndc1_Nup/PF09531_10/0_021FecCD/PF01032_18/0_039FecCD/PF01032_18/3_4e02FUSC_2/PF13515_6/0_043FUSC_2/PF13515_6/6_5e02Fst_toxin/PF13955_6/0_18DUF4282/PF14110_6/2_4e02DUF4282/PF14110_6/1_6UPF0060/PF02694_15/1_2UPF0060/PF02694_15/4_4e02ThrE/PF06738_
MFVKYSLPARTIFICASLGTILVCYTTVLSWTAGQPNPIIVGAVITLVAGPALLIYAAYDMKHPTIYHLSCALCSVSSIYMLLNAVLHSNAIPSPTAPPGKPRSPPPPLWNQLPNPLQWALEQSIVYVSMMASIVFLFATVLLLRMGPPDQNKWIAFREHRRMHR